MRNMERIDELEAEVERLREQFEDEHKQRLGDVESWTHWRNKYEVDTYALRERAEQATAQAARLAEALEWLLDEHVLEAIAHERSAKTLADYHRTQQECVCHSGSVCGEACGQGKHHAGCTQQGCG